ncbi:MAG: copper transporter, partial [Coriobacteriales bacterium]|nr:copper transporter [Coriobacteriales bacterium]
MYNFRYHLVTIISIFAALALGLLLGVAVTGSDLVRDASSNLAESLADQFDELRETNDGLAGDLQVKTGLSNQLLSDWQRERLSGRVIVILVRENAGGTALTRELSGLVLQGGGVPVVVRVSPTMGFGIDDERSLASFQKLLPAVEGEEYATTFARALVDEWTSVHTGTDGATDDLEKAYPLTERLMDVGHIKVTVDYQAILQNLNLQHALDLPVVLSQRAAYETAQQLRLPYSVNGIINTAAFSLDDEGQLLTDTVALQLTTQLDAKGREGKLPLLTPHTDADGATGAGAGAGTTPEGAAGEGEASTAEGAGAEGEAATAEGEAAASTGEGEQPQAGDGESGEGQGSPEGEANSSQANNSPSFSLGGWLGSLPGEQSPELSRYAVLVQPDGGTEPLLSALHDSGLSAVLSPFDPTGRYSILALLCGSPTGV